MPTFPNEAGHTDSGYAAELMEIAADMEVAGVLEKPGADDELCEWAALLLQATENGELEKILAEVVAEVEPTQSKAEEDISMDRAEEEMCEQVTSASGLSLTDVQSPVPPKQELFPSPPTVSRTTTKARPHTRNLWGQCPRPSEAFTAAGRRLSRGDACSRSKLWLSCHFGMVSAPPLLLGA